MSRDKEIAALLGRLDLEEHRVAWSNELLRRVDAGTAPQRNKATAAKRKAEAEAAIVKLKAQINKLKGE